MGNQQVKKDKRYDLTIPEQLEDEKNISMDQEVKKKESAQNINKLAVDGQEGNKKKYAIIVIFIVLGIVFHYYYILSIFNIYFQYRIIEGMNPINPDYDPPAKRLLVFTMDGQISRCIFEQDPKTKEIYAPFLQNQASQTGSFGISHSEAPTESRPAHIGIFAGHQEDFGNLRTFWNINYAKGDHIFNESANSWICGDDMVTSIFRLRKNNISKQLMFSYHIMNDKNMDIMSEYYDQYCVNTFNEYINNVTNPNISQSQRDNLDHKEKQKQLQQEQNASNSSSKPEESIIENSQQDYSFEQTSTNDYFSMIHSVNLDHEFLENQTAQLNFLNSNRSIFFFHMLSPDEIGHIYKPHSSDYHHNLASLDSKIRAIVKKCNDFYQDSATAFIVTSDHGMNQQGSHGDADGVLTRTPLIAWGAGLSGPEPGDVLKVQRSSSQLLEDYNKSGSQSSDSQQQLQQEQGQSLKRQGQVEEDFDKDNDLIVRADDDTDFAMNREFEWSDHLKQLRRRDIRQQDLTPLMAVLIGVPIPMNNLGVLPMQYLSKRQEDRENVEKMFLSNARQLLELYSVKEEQAKRGKIYYEQYKFSVEDGQELVKRIKQVLKAGEYQVAHNLTELLIKNLRKAILYTEQYSWPFLENVIFLGYCGWMGACIALIVRYFSGDSENSIKINKKSGSFSYKKIVNIMFCCCFLLNQVWQIMNNSPDYFFHYMYFVLLFWWIIALNLKKAKKLLVDNLSVALLIKIIILGILIMVGMHIITEGLHDRLAIQNMFILMGVGQCVFYGRRLIRQNQAISLMLWAATTAVMYYFPGLNPLQSQYRDPQLHLLGFMLCGLLISLGICYLVKTQQYFNAQNTQKIITLFSCLFVISGLVQWQTDKYLFALPKKQAPQYLVLTSNFIFVSCVTGIAVLPFIQKKQHFALRLGMAFLILSPLMNLLTQAYEMIFYSCLFLHLLAWVYMEHSIFFQELEDNVKNNNLQQSQFGNINYQVIANQEKRQEEKGEAKICIKHAEESSGSCVKSREKFSLDLVRPIFTNFFLCIICFFAIQDVRSIGDYRFKDKNFMINSVLRFSADFGDFTLILFICKYLIPLVLVSVGYGIVQKNVLRVFGQGGVSLLLFSCAIADFLSLDCYFEVKNFGSWKSIGHNIARVIVTNALMAVLIVLQAVARFLSKNINVWVREDNSSKDYDRVK